jgi:uncharacterized protein (DUF58 family)
MLTPRGWWFLVLSLTVAAMGGALVAQYRAPALWLASLTLIIWFGIEWAIFLVQARITMPQLRVTRTVLHNGEESRTLWCSQEYDVLVELHLPHGVLSYTLCDDRAPVGATTTGSRSWEGRITPDLPAKWQYQIRPDQSGMTRFEGVAVKASDLQGFFYFEHFVRAPVELLVLPQSAYFRRARRGDKRINSLPPPGVHRFRRPGTGSELLELRDYQPGDPPRRIAWRLSAKREQLITRVYESEVPLRCTMLIDASNATRLGPPGQTFLSSLTNISSGVAGMAMANRDLVGLAVTTDRGCRYLPPARTSAQLIHIHQALARATALLPVVGTDAVEDLIATALPVANDLYPDLMQPSVNRFPWWLGWLCPAPYDVRWHGRVVDARWRRRIAMFSPTHRTYSAARKRLAALIACKYRLPSAAVAYLFEDNRILAKWLQHFLVEHRVPVNLPVYDHAGRDRFSGRRVMNQMAKALLRAVGRGRDNELFVLMGEFVERAEDLAPLIKAVRVARGRHHQLLIIQSGRLYEAETPTTDMKLGAMLAIAERARRARAWHVVRQQFGRLGVPMIAADEGDPTALILHRLEQIRMAEGARRT